MELRVDKINSEFPIKKITESVQVNNYLKNFWHDDILLYESFFILLLNQANETVGYAKISQGGIAGTVVDTKIVAKYALDSLCPAIILAHNHPSGNPEPSKADISITKKIKEGLSLLDIKVLDHLILFEGGYTSLADENLM
jgi:DNA repair protein RadC